MNTFCKYFLPVLGIGLTSCLGSSSVETADYNVVPRLNTMSVDSVGTPFILDDDVAIIHNGDEDMTRNARFLAEYVKNSTGIELTKATSNKVIKLRATLVDENKEAYRLNIYVDSIVIDGASPAAVFHALQTVRKSLPLTDTDKVYMPQAQIYDFPRFEYRGMHLDVCRHFFPIDFVKKYIDILALHNINTFHWHLTEDQGWRIASDKYPKLTEVGAWRDSTVVGYMNSEKYDSIRHGGFYTKEELREVVEYANERYINIIPEIDMPGHMLAALASYPEFGCTGGPYTVCPDWGIFEDVLCIGNENAMKFLEDIFAELIEIFPSKYIHIGGDEVPRKRWEECPKCQARIKELGLKDNKEHSAESRLQNYCTNRIEKFLNARGRQIIGWDEILNGELAPDAIVMSGNSYAGGVRAAQMNHRVVMAPNTTYYFDYYQTPDTEDEPLSIGGCITVEKVYNSDPTSELNDEQAANVLGIQANMWTEYVQTTDHVEYMVLPRMAALAEVQWCPKGEKDYDDFTKRLVHMLNIYQHEGYNYAKHVYDIKYDFNPSDSALMVTLSTIDNAPIYYTLDGSEPTESSTKYDGNIAITDSAEFRAIAIREVGKTKIVEKSISFNKATLKPVTLTTCQPYSNYTFKGAATLTDGLSGNDNFATGAWLGFVGEDITAVVDLGVETDINHIGATALTYLDAWIMAPIEIKFAVSNDNKTFIDVYNVTYPVETDYKKHCIVNYASDITPTKARYVKLYFKRSPALPKGHAGAGLNPFLFIDEITIK